MMIASILPAPRSRLRLPHHQSTPDMLPGARDVSTPYGIMRVYEWGPSNGVKMLFLHGLSTPAVVFEIIAKGLAKGGARVCVLDLWGRGYSDSPTCIPHDERLYVTQILLAISTSPLPWTGNESGGSFRLIGYSLGGGLAMSFARYFPQLVSGIVLLAPGGLHRGLPKGYRSFSLRYPRLFPQSYMKRRISKLLIGDSGLHEAALETGKENEVSKGTSEETTITTQESQLLDVNAIVNWQIHHHPGFIHSVTSSLRYAPITNQHDKWSKVGSYIRGDQREPSSSTEALLNRLHGSKVLLVLGKSDDIVDNKQICTDAARTLGVENLEVARINGGHNFPTTHGEEVVEAISRFWGIGVDRT